MIGIFIEIVGVAGYHDLVGLLEVLFVHKVISDLGREGIEGDPFQMIRKSQVPCYFHNLFQ